MAAKTASDGATRRSVALIVWAVLFLLAGAGLVGLGIYAWLALPPTPPWAVVALAGGGGALVTAAFFLALGLFVVKLGPKGSLLSNDQKLILRAATATVLVDRDATHVEIEALRVWVERNFGFTVAFDELRGMAEANAGNRDAVVTAVADHHRSHPSWGKDDDQALISACASVIVADLRNRDEEVDYLRRLAEAVEYDAAKRDALIAKLKALALELEGLVIAAIVSRPADDDR